MLTPQQRASEIHTARDRKEKLPLNQALPVIAGLAVLAWLPIVALIFGVRALI